MDAGQLMEACLSLASHVISTKGKDKNVVLSPLSLLVVFDLLEALEQQGEIKSSKAAEVVSNVFADASLSGGPRLSYANGAWIDRSVDFGPQRLETLRTAFRAACAYVDFKTMAEKVRKEVNIWAERKTNGLIKDLLPPGSVGSSTSVIGANAVYFKGKWHEEYFDAHWTRPRTFFLLNGTRVQVPFMSGEGSQFAEAFDGFKVLRLSYASAFQDIRRYSMYMFLPDTRHGLAALVERMGTDSRFLDRHLPNRKRKLGDFRIPKFKINFGFRASSNEVVKEQNAGRNHSNTIFFQKSVIKVNEDGTEAAAASTGFAVSCARPPSPPELNFVADHPFLFLIREVTTGAVLFVGQVLNPRAG